MDTTLDFDRTKGTWGALSTPLQLVTFGHHILHHYFPTVDTSKLEYLYPALYETCEEMGETYPFHSVPHLIQGLHTTGSSTGISLIWTVVIRGGKLDESKTLFGKYAIIKYIR